MAAAVISSCGTYRYYLTREWDDGRCVTWLMLNPSTADAFIDDPTIRKCVGFSRRWGFARLVVVNLFALRSTDPSALLRNTDPVGQENDFYLAKGFAEGREIICAWGGAPRCQNLIAQRVVRILPLMPAHHTCYCLGKRQDGAPRHPLMLAYATRRILWKMK